VTPLAREMILQTMRWGPDRRVESAQETLFFRALGAQAVDWVKEPLPFRLPVARTPELARAIDLVVETMADSPSLDDVARRAGLSSRTLARRLRDEAQTSYRELLGRVRMMRATELLAQEGARVTEVALAVGFDSPGAFSRAFEAFFSETPRDYRKRRTAAPPP
jgi:transcriptional regulator GlxA family with amidase domain